MEYLGEFVAGDIIPYFEYHHNDTGTLESPTSPTARHRTPAGVWGDITVPAVEDAQTGLFGNLIDTTGFANGLHIIGMKGVVTDDKTQGKTLCFQIVPRKAASLPTLAQIEATTVLAKEATLATVASYIDTEITSILSTLQNVGGLTGGHVATIQFYRTATVTPIPDVLCDVYDSTETTRLNGTQLKSDVNGQVAFSRDNGTYKVRAMLAGFTFTTGTLVVNDGNVPLTMYGSAITIPNPPVAGTQTLFGNVRELDWGVSTGDTITAVIADKGQVVNGTLIQHLNLSTTVDANSQFSLTVPKGSVIRLTVKDHGTHEITINQEDTYDVATYLTE